MVSMSLSLFVASDRAVTDIDIQVADDVEDNKARTTTTTTTTRSLFIFSLDC
jgi:hypothetical protein